MTKINLLGANGAPELVWADGMSRSEVRRAVKSVGDRQVLQPARWEDIHGRLD